MTKSPRAPRSRWAAGPLFFLLTSLPGCGGGGPPVQTGPSDIELAQSLASARSAFNQGADAQAATLYARALKRARVMDDAGAIADAAYDYAAALIRVRMFDQAADALREAESESIRAKRRVVDVRLLQARVARLRNHNDDALAIADRVLSDPAANTTDKMQAWLLKGHVAVEFSIDADSPPKVDPAQIDSARRAFAQAKSLIGQGVSPALAASIAQLEGELATATGDFPAAGAAFDRAADFSRQAHLYGDMRHALAQAALGYELGKDFTAAADRQFRAARSALADADPAAMKMLDRAADYAKQANDAALNEKIELLRKQPFPKTP